MLKITGSVVSVLERNLQDKQGRPFTIYRTYLIDGQNSAPIEVQCHNQFSAGEEVTIPVYIRAFVRKNGAAGFQLNEQKVA